MPHIALINASSRTADREVAALLPALERQWRRDLAPAWGVGAATFSFATARRQPPRGAWWLVILDDARRGHVLGYHDLTNEGLPMSKVFATRVRARNASLGVVVSHEIVEMAVDPWINTAFQDAAGTFWSGEICDPVEGDRYGYEIGGIRVSDFITPDWYAHRHAGPIRDFKRRVDAPFQVLPGAYTQKYHPRRGWVTIHGPTDGEPRRRVAPGSRRERRARGSRLPWQPSEPRHD